MADTENKKRPWLGPFNDAWKKYSGNDLPFKTVVRALQGVIKEVGEAEALDRFENYLAETPPKYHSVYRFAEKHGQYKSELPVGPAGKPLAVRKMIL